jgi:hypothetical protein
MYFLVHKEIINLINIYAHGQMSAPFPTPKARASPDQQYIRTRPYLDLHRILGEACYMVETS